MAWLDDDLRFAVRLFRKSPGFTAAALLTLTLAIGANTALFSVVNRVLLQPLPFLEPERIFQVVRRETSSSRVLSILSVPQYAFLAGQAQPFSGLAAYRSSTSGFNLSAENLLEQVQGARVTHGFFAVLGTPPVLGRDFLPEEDVEGAPRVVVLSHGLWQQRFGGRPDVIGQAISLNKEPYTVIGVAPPSLEFPEGAQLWTLLRLDLASVEDAHYLAVIGRVKPGVELEQVGALIRAQGEQLRVLRPGALAPHYNLEAGELQALKTQETRPALRVLMGAVGLVLLMACVNLASLQLARATARERELAMRAVLGASPGRLARQLLTESLLLSVSGGLLGLLLARGAVPLLLALAPTDLPLPQEVPLDGAVLAFTLGLSLLTGVLFGLLPAWQASRTAAGGSLQVGAWRASGGPAVTRTRRLLVAGEVALAVILLIGAALLAKSFLRLREVAPGFDPENVLALKLFLPEASYGSPESFEDFTRRVQQRVRALPGVQAAGFTLTLPFETGLRLGFLIHERRPEGGDTSREGLAFYRPVTRGYFDVMRIELVRGRLLDDQDRSESLPVALINESAARRYWPGANPLGRRITIGTSSPQTTDPVPREIIGVVRDVHEDGLQKDPPLIIYIPMGQMPAPLHARSIRLRPQHLLVRASGDPQLLAEAVAREIREVDSVQLVAGSRTMTELVSRSLGLQRFSTLLMGLMAGLALVLAAVGVYGVLSFLVNQRARELSVRLALGATPWGVVWLVLRQGMAPVTAGAVVGVAGALGLTRLLSHLLYSVSALDPVSFALAPAVLMGVALLAMVPPAARASRVDPMESLRTE
jgi:putative ABC transport system permease protein